MSELKNFTIYRIDLEKFEAHIWKQYSVFDEDVLKKECNKFNDWCARKGSSHAFVYRQDKPQSSLIMPVI